MNTKSIAVASMLAVGALTTWRLLKLLSGFPPSPTRSAEEIKRVWAGAAVALIISLLTDLDSDLGAAFGAAFVVSLSFGGASSPAGALSGMVDRITTPASSEKLGASSAQPSHSQPHEPSSSPSGPCPSGTVRYGNQCLPIQIN